MDARFFPGQTRLGRGWAEAKCRHKMPEANREVVTSLERLGQGAEVLLEDYLNDTVAPLQIAESVLEFLNTEPKKASEIILQWADQQLNVNLHAIPMSDLLYHALKKIQIFEELGLANAERLQGLVEQTAQLVRGYCPKDELAEFDLNMARLHEKSRLFRTVELLHRAGDEPEIDPFEEPEDEADLDELRKKAAEQRAAEKAVAEEEPFAFLNAHPKKEQATTEEPGQEKPLTNPEKQAAQMMAERRDKDPDLATIRQQQVALGLKRFAMLVGTLEKAKEMQADESWMPHLLSSAALGAKNHDEFRGYLARLKKVGLEDLHMEQVFRSVAETMPDWHLEGETEAQPNSAATVVMERVVELTEHEAEKSARLQEIVSTAVEHFNRARLGSALTLFDLADRLLKSSELAAFEKNRVRSSARSELKMAPFRKMLEQPEKLGELRRVLRFFPDLRVEGLVRRLLKEENRKNRHMIMDLLRIHGREAREAVAEVLISSTALSGREWPWFFVRNLIRILRDIETDAVSMSEFELEAVIGYADPSHAIQVVREAIAYLGTVQHPKAIEALIQRFHYYREASPKLRDGADADMAKIQSLSLSFLLRSDNPHARSVALDVLLSGSRWSDGHAQLLSVLGSVNLAADRAALDRLLKAARLRLRGQGLSGKLQLARLRLPRQAWAEKLRRIGPVREAGLQSFVQALSGTPAPAVTELLAEIEALEPTRRLAHQAHRVKAKLDEMALEVDPDSEVKLAGDLDVFGLPNLVQSLNQSEASGTLTVEAKDQNRKAVIRILYGKFVDAKVGALRGAEALYLLMEKPLASTFWFVSEADQSVTKHPQELKGLLFEGMRRRDEYERLRLLVPDQGIFAVTGQKPTAPPDERDPQFFRNLWIAVTQQGATAEKCEAGGAADPYRVRKLLLHWLEAGQLRIASVPTKS